MRLQRQLEREREREGEGEGKRRGKGREREKRDRSSVHCELASMGCGMKGNPSNGQGLLSIIPE
jgi:hypothetical protein